MDMAACSGKNVGLLLYVYLWPKLDSSNVLN